MRLLLIAALLITVGCSNGNKNEEIVLPDKPGEITVITGEKNKSDNVSPFMGYTVTGESAVKYAPDGNETAVTKEIGAYVVVRNHPLESIEKSLLMKRLSKKFIVKCSACHDNYANGVIGPSLLTKTEDQIYEMIRKYKTDEEQNVLMRVLVSKMDDEEIRFIAADIAKFNEEVRKEQEAGK